MARTILIGDLHGCYEEAVELLDKLKVCADDHVIFVGDLVDRGPESGKCIDLAIRRERVQKKPAAILGNHEEKHLDYDDDVARLGRPPSNLPPTHQKTRDQLFQHHYEYLRRLPLYLRIPEHNAVAVHAGVFPGRTIEGQKAKHLLHIQMIRPYDFDQSGNMTINERSCWASRIPEKEQGWKFWHHFWDGPERVIFGHSVLDKPLMHPKAVGIDGGCCFGLELWALVLPDWEIVKVRSRMPIVRPLNNKLYLIDGDVATY